MKPGLSAPKFRGNLNHQLIGDSLELLLQVLLPGLTLDKARTVAEANVVALALAGLGVCGAASRHRKG